MTSEETVLSTAGCSPSTEYGRLRTGSFEIDALEVAFGCAAMGHFNAIIFNEAGRP